MEYWSDERKEYWNNGKTESTSILFLFTQYSNIPLFHPSIVKYSNTPLLQ
jgi:hypothetical protein